MTAAIVGQKPKADRRLTAWHRFWNATPEEHFNAIESMLATGPRRTRKDDRIIRAAAHAVLTGQKGSHG